MDKQIRQANALTTSKFFSEKYDLNIIYTIMGQIKESDLPTTLYKIAPSNISEHTGRRVRNDDFSKSVNRLLSTIFSITHEKGILKTTFISSADFQNDGAVTIAIDNRLRPYLFDLKKNFTIFGLHAAIALNSVYSSRLYLMLCQFRSTGEMWVKVDELRERFCLNGEKPKFVQWADFEKYVLKVAWEEINEKADFQFDYELRREGRKIVAVNFKIRKVIKIEANIPTATPISTLISTNKIQLKNDDERHNRLIDRLSGFGFTENQIVQILKKNTEPELWKIIFDYNLIKDTIKNTVPYLLKAFSL